jgi:protein-tyrosine-phosphatase
MRKIRHAARRSADRWLRSRRRRKAISEALQARRVLFVCYGNIMRSPFASAYFNRRRNEHGAIQAIAASAGVYEPAGRPADPRAVAAARRWDIDLSSHRSTALDDQLVASADLIFVMDRTNLDEIRRRHPGTRSKTYLLGTLDPDRASDTEIPDPYAAGDGATEHAYARIAAAVDALVRAALPQPQWLRQSTAVR